MIKSGEQNAMSVFNCVGTCVFLTGLYQFIIGWEIAFTHILIGANWLVFQKQFLDIYSPSCLILDLYHLVFTKLLLKNT